ncbi:reverse transcriptase [Tanacetum coccineum]
MSTAYYPQTDGQSEVVNRCLECYLRCMTREKPKEWMQWLSLAEFWYNTNFHTSINTTPFEVVYGQKPPIHFHYLAGESIVEADKDEATWEKYDDLIARFPQFDADAT